MQTNTSAADISLPPNTPVRKCVNTDYWAPGFKDGKPTGCVNYCRQQKMSDVVAQINAVLETIVNDDGDTARSLYHWFSTAGESHDVDFPKGEPFAALRHGSNEGYFIEILVSQRRPVNYELCATIKFLADKAFVYRVAQELNDALWEGGFSTCPPPAP